MFTKSAPYYDRLYAFENYAEASNKLQKIIKDLGAPRQPRCLTWHAGRASILSSYASTIRWKALTSTRSFSKLLERACRACRSISAI